MFLGGFWCFEPVEGRKPGGKKENRWKGGKQVEGRKTCGWEENLWIGGKPVEGRKTDGKDDSGVFNARNR